MSQSAHPLPDAPDPPHPLADVIAIRDDVDLCPAEPEFLPVYRGPLDADSRGVYPTALRGGVVDDPAEIAAIASRVEAGRRRWWRR